MSGPTKLFPKRPGVCVEIGGLSFRLLSFHNRNHWLNIEPGFGLTWRIIGFRDRGTGKAKRLQWTSRGVWVDADEKDPDGVFEWGEDLDTQIRLACSSKQADPDMAGVRKTGGLRPVES